MTRRNLDVARSIRPRMILTGWEIWTFDVWGNATDGWQTNDRFCLSRHHPIRLTITVNNKGTSHQFESATPTDQQIKNALGVNCAIDTDGDDIHIYVERSSDGKPLGEMICVSHSSLSPIRKGDKDAA